MIIKTREFDPELRPIGAAMRLVMPYFDEKRLVFCGRLMRKTMQGIWLGKKTTLTMHYLIRGNGSVLRLCICRAKTGVKPRAAGLLWIHGGGFAMGLPEQDYLYMDELCGEGDCVAVLPDYRLTWERPYPAALEDCHLALKWMQDNAERLGIRPECTVVAGASAGGSLTASLTLYERDTGGLPIAYQMPLYPLLDDRETKSNSHNDAPGWNTRSNKAALRLFLGDLYGREDTPAYAAPARAENLKNLPPACTFVGTLDPFLDEVTDYVNRLREAGVPVKFKIIPAAFHGFDLTASRAKISKEARQFVRAAFKQAITN